MTRTRCPLCSHRLNEEDIRPLGVVFQCPSCEACLKVVPAVPKFLPMIAYLGWSIALASWGVQSFWPLLLLAVIAPAVSAALLSISITILCGVSLDPVTEAGTLPLGETRDSGQ